MAWKTHTHTTAIASGCRAYCSWPTAIALCKYKIVRLHRQYFEYFLRY